jgi:hypothetical protein
VHLPDLVDLPGQLENPLGGRGFPRIDVRKDANVTVFRKIGHGLIFGCLN